MKDKKTYYFLTSGLSHYRHCPLVNLADEYTMTPQEERDKTVYKIEILKLTQRELEEEIRKRLCESPIVIEGNEVEIDNIVIQTKYKEEK